MKLYIKYLGEIDIQIDNQSITHHLSEKAKVIILYMVLNNKIYHRNTFKTMLWKDFESKSANQNLRQALWNIRNETRKINSEVDIFINVSKSTIQLNSDINISSDIQEFYKQINDDISLDRKSIQQFIGKYNGTFMENIYIYDALDINNWIYFQREEIQKKYFDFLYKTSRKLRDEKNYVLSGEILNELIYIDSYNETLYLDLMKNHTLQGNRHFAINTYQEMQKVLREELNISPNSEINDFYNSLLSNKKLINPKEKVSTEPSKIFEDALNNSCVINIFVTKEKEHEYIFKNHYIHHHNNNQFIELVKIPGKRLPYEGVFEFIDEYIHYLDNSISTAGIEKLLNYRMNKIDETNLFYQLEKYINKTLKNNITLIIYNLSHVDEKTIDLISYLYRKNTLKNIKIIISYNKNWETNRIKFFINALKNEKNIKIRNF